MKSCLSQSQFQNREFKSLIKNQLLSEFLEDKNDSNVLVNVPKERSVLSQITCCRDFYIRMVHNCLYLLAFCLYILLQYSVKIKCYSYKYESKYCRYNKTIDDTI